jgi:OFA family oxalate/formate antiporter-like MFS transporter
LVPLASVLSAGGSWDTVFISAAAVAIIAGVSAKLVLAPMRERWIADTVSKSGLPA